MKTPALRRKAAERLWGRMLQKKIFRPLRDWVMVHRKRASFFESMQRATVLELQDFSQRYPMFHSILVSGKTQKPFGMGVFLKELRRLESAWAKRLKGYKDAFHFKALERRRRFENLVVFKLDPHRNMRRGLGKLRFSSSRNY
jgi:hypothetical protein